MLTHSSASVAPGTVLVKLVSFIVLIIMLFRYVIAWNKMRFYHFKLAVPNNTVIPNGEIGIANQGFF